MIRGSHVPGSTITVVLQYDGQVDETEAAAVARKLVRDMSDVYAVSAWADGTDDAFRATADFDENGHKVVTGCSTIDPEEMD